jgi:hypothetical protein
VKRLDLKRIVNRLPGRFGQGGGTDDGQYRGYNPPVCGAG